MSQRPALQRMRIGQGFPETSLVLPSLLTPDPPEAAHETCTATSANEWLGLLSSIVQSNLHPSVTGLAAADGLLLCELCDMDT